MPKRRQPRAIWDQTRLRVLTRDQWACIRCQRALTVSTAHIDHIQSGKRGTNALINLRALCRRCHVLRADSRHRGLIAAALRDGIIPPDWRPLVWDDPFTRPAVTSPAG
jgi:5-methylcytosine-specific restriction protein A